MAGALLVLLVAAGIATWMNWGAGAPAHHTTVALTKGPIARTVTATGTVNPELTIIVGTYVSGVIQELFCDYNTVVKKGQVCAKIVDQRARDGDALLLAAGELPRRIARAVGEPEQVEGLGGERRTRSALRRCGHGVEQWQRHIFGGARAGEQVEAKPSRSLRMRAKSGSARCATSTPSKK